MRSRTVFTLLLSAGLVLAACDGGGAELSTTSSMIAGGTEAPGVSTTATSEAPGDGGTVTPTTLVGEIVEEYEIVSRIETENGDILHVVVPPGAYTDVDLDTFIFDLKEANPGLWGAEVFDNEAALEAFLVPEAQRTPEQQTLLDDHHFASLIDGDTMAFRGPFSEFGEHIIGS